MSDSSFDCIILGSGHAGSCAALSAVENGCKRVLIVDKCPEEWVGGNGYFTAGAHRTVHGGLRDLLPIVHNVPETVADHIDMDPYTREDFVSDMMRLGNGKPKPSLVDVVVDNSRDAIGWLANSVGVPFIFSFNRQAYEVDGRQKFWGGMVLSVEDGGKGLMKAHTEALRCAGVQVWFESPVIELLMKEDSISGVLVRKAGQILRLNAPAVILASGGFESSPRMRVKHLGPDWEKAKVRGTPYNTGDGIVMAQAIGAKIAGDWGGCHSTAWDADAPDNAGQRSITNQLTKSGYPLGVMVNSKGERFVDEGEDFRNYTYAKFGRAILSQPGGFAFQVWDSQVTKFLRAEEYGDGIVKKILADSLDHLADKLVVDGLEDKETFLQTLGNFNEAAHAYQTESPGLTWNPAIKDRLSTQSSHHGLSLPKSNWALAIDKPPFMAVKVSCAITFTFGGLAIDPQTANVLHERDGMAINGLFATGEIVGDLFHGNYPGGSGLTAGAVFGRRCGSGAASMLQKI